jgi:hypothetical protein
MRRSAAAVGSAVFFVVAPGVVAGLVPWLISGWQLPRLTSPLAILRLAAGVVLLALAVVVLVRAFARFVVEGGGTPAPVAPSGWWWVVTTASYATRCIWLWSPRCSDRR